jgi:transposase InsO family protein
MARSTYYYHLKRSKHPDGYDGVRAKIREIFEKHRKRYGYRRITDELRNEGTLVNHKTVLKLMVQMGLKAGRRKQRYRSYKGEAGKIAPNLLGRNFKAEKPYKKWTTDITQVNIHDNKIYLSPILDMYNGEIISYVISNRPSLRMVLNTVQRAVKKVEMAEGLILHSDQGWHYQQKKYQKLLSDNHIIQSMSRKGNCLDNAMMENFFGLMKNELLYLQEWNSVSQFENELRAYIHYYNYKRIKLRLKGKSPVQYRTLYNNN